MKYEARVAAAVAMGLLVVASGLSGCSTWYQPTVRAPVSAPPIGNSPTDMKLSTVTYVRNLCELPKDQRDPALRELNQAVVPHHVVIYCGRGGTP